MRIHHRGALFLEKPEDVGHESYLFTKPLSAMLPCGKHQWQWETETPELDRHLNQKIIWKW